jgi:hypothetical protein
MIAIRARSQRLSAPLLAVVAGGLVAGISCSLAGLADPPQGSASSGGGAASSGSGLVYEAEDAGLLGKFVIGHEPDASNGEYVYVPAGAGCSPGLSEVVFDVVPPNAGTYVIWARALAPNNNHETFFVSVDVGPQALLRLPVGYWEEVSVFDDAAEVKSAIHYAWDAGHHQVVFACRSDGTLLDRIRIDPVPP